MQPVNERHSLNANATSPHQINNDIQNVKRVPTNELERLAFMALQAEPIKLSSTTVLHHSYKSPLANNNKKLLGKLAHFACET